MTKAVCCFCTRAIQSQYSVDITVPLDEGATQALWAHPGCLADQLHPEVPTLLSRSKAQVFPVPRHSDSVIQEWSSELSSRFKQEPQSFASTPQRYMDFPGESVRIELMDGSTASFSRAFALVSYERRAVAVFTEHCGHHVFPLHDARVYQAGQQVYPPI